MLHRLGEQIHTLNSSIVVFFSSKSSRLLHTIALFMLEYYVQRAATISQWPNSTVRERERERETHTHTHRVTFHNTISWLLWEALSCQIIRSGTGCKEIRHIIITHINTLWVCLYVYPYDWVFGCIFVVCAGGNEEGRRNLCEFCTCPYVHIFKCLSVSQHVCIHTFYVCKLLFVS